MTDRNGLSKIKKILYVVALSFGILGALYGFGDFLFFSQSEGEALMDKFFAHEDWGRERYKEVVGRLDRIDGKIDSLIFYRQQTLFEIRELRRELKTKNSDY